MLSRTDTSLPIRWTDNADGEDNYRFTWGLATDATVTHVATVAARPAGGRSAEIRPDDKAGERGFA